MGKLVVGGLRTRGRLADIRATDTPSVTAGTPVQTNQSLTTRTSSPVFPTTVSGDIAILIGTRSASSGAWTVPGGWTNIFTADRGAMWWLTCAGTEGGTSINVSTNNSNNNTTVIIVFRSTLTATPTDVTASQTAVSPTTDISYPTVTPTTSKSYCIASGHGRTTNNAANVPGGTNPTYTKLIDSRDFFTVGSAAQASPRVAVFVGTSTSTSALGARTVNEDGFDNFYHGSTTALKAVP